MFIGHYAPAFLAAAAYPRAPKLAAMFIATQFIDLGFFSLALVNVEHFRMVPGTTPQTSMDLYHMPYTHSLIGTIAFAAIWCGIARALRIDWRATLIGGAVVISHWFLDLLVHLPDLTLAGTPPKLGFGLWRHPWIERPLELVLTFGAFGWFLHRTRGARLPAMALAAALLVVQTVDWHGAIPTRIVDPIPPTIPIMALAAYTILALLAFWVERTRKGTGPAVTTL